MDPLPVQYRDCADGTFIFSEREHAALEGLQEENRRRFSSCKQYLFHRKTARWRAVSDGTIERGQTNDQIAKHITSAQ